MVAGATPAGADPVPLDMSTLPPPPWFHAFGDGAHSETIAGGQLTIATADFDEYVLNDPSSPWGANADNAAGWTVTARVKVDPSSQGVCTDRGPVQIWAEDNYATVIFGLTSTGVCLAFPDLVVVPFDTSVFHTYDIAVQGLHVVVKADGQVLIDHQMSGGYPSNPTLSFGDGDGNDNTATTSTWDFLTYDTTANCTIVGTPGPDHLDGTNAADTICGEGGDDVINGLNGDDLLLGGPGNDTLVGSQGADRIIGGDGNDVLVGGLGDDSLVGGTGDDSFQMLNTADGADDMHGDAGFDTANYAQRTAAVTVDVDDNANDGASGAGEGDNVHRDVERVIGGSGPDMLIDHVGSTTTLVGNAGDDYLDATDGNGSGGDKVYGGPGTDTCLTADGRHRYNCP